jgi:hypothetical protein
MKIHALLLAFEPLQIQIPKRRNLFTVNILSYQTINIYTGVYERSSFSRRERLLWREMILSQRPLASLCLVTAMAFPFNRYFFWRKKCKP